MLKSILCSHTIVDIRQENRVFEKKSKKTYCRKRKTAVPLQRQKKKKQLRITT